jgi:hypothetical protein
LRRPPTREPVPMTPRTPQMTPLAGEYPEDETTQGGWLTA